MSTANGTSLLMVLTVLFAFGASSCFADILRVPTQYPTIQAAIDAAANGDTVLISPGTYREALDLKGKAVTVQGEAGAAATILDAEDLDRPAVTCAGGETVAGTFLQGLTLANASAVGNGGGLRCVTGAGITVRDCEFINNQVFETFGASGAAAFVAPGATLVAERCAFLRNGVGLPGTLFGGAIYCEDGVVNLSHCRLEENRAFDGGAIALRFGGTLNAVNCLIARNVGDNFGEAGVLWASDSTVTLINCTASGNYGTDPLSPFGGIYLNNTPLFARGCIFWDNSGEFAGDPPNEWFLDIDMAYSCVESRTFEGPGNIGLDPLFRDADNGDYRLSAGSPCIDAGDNSALDPVEDALDLDGLPRFADDPATADTGNGTAPLVDMGAYEYRPEGDDGSPGVNLAASSLGCASGQAGPLLVNWSGATPSGPAALLLAQSVNAGKLDVPPSQPCAGTPLGLGRQGLRLAWRGRSDAAGSGLILEPRAPQRVCDAYLQLIDLTACEVSNVARIE